MTKQELFNQLKIDLSKGQAQEEVHLVDWKKRRQEIRTNPAKSTKIYIDAKTPELWSRLQLQKDRYATIGRDPGITAILMCRALEAFGDSVLRDWVAQGIDGIPDPPDNLPPWAK